jgi:hypothetical protein
MAGKVESETDKATARQERDNVRAKWLSFLLIVTSI